MDSGIIPWPPNPVQSWPTRREFFQMFKKGKRLQDLLILVDNDLQREVNSFPAIKIKSWEDHVED